MKTKFRFRAGTRERALLLGDSLTGSEKLDVRRADVRDDAVLRAGDFAERSELAGMIHADFKNTCRVIVGRRQNRERQSDMIVQITLGRVHRKFLRKHSSREILGGSFSIRSGNTNDGNI